jgi:hypothetical protein
MTGDHGIRAAATWRRDATTIKATVMQNDHSRAAQFTLASEVPWSSNLLEKAPEDSEAVT